MPLAEYLPKEIEGFGYRQAAHVDPGKDFHLYMGRVIKQLDTLLALPSQGRSASQSLDTLSSRLSASGLIVGPTLAPPPAADDLVRSVQITPTGYGFNDNRGQVFAKLKINMGTVEAVFAYLKSSLARTEEEIVNGAVALLIKYDSNPGPQALRRACLLMQTSPNRSLKSL